MVNTHVTSRFVTNLKSDGYKLIQEKMLNWTSKGRQLDLKRAPFTSQLGIFQKPKNHVLIMKCVKIVDKYL